MAESGTGRNLIAVFAVPYTGVGVVCVYETNHLLWGGSYALRMARANCVGGNICHASLRQVVLQGGSRPTSSKGRALEKSRELGGIILSQGTFEHAEFGYRAMVQKTGVRLPMDSIRQVDL